MNNFNYRKYLDCYFIKGEYVNGNLALEIYNKTEGLITRVTINPGIELKPYQIAVKDYSENEGMVDFLKSLGIIEDEPIMIIPSGFVQIPVYNLTNKGISIL